MNPIELLLIAAIAVVFGTIAQLTSSFSKGGWIVNPLIGFFGALAGVFLSRSLNAPEVYNLNIGPVAFPIVYAVIGAVLFLAGIGFFLKPGRN